jgi:hypothetical protein
VTPFCTNSTSEPMHSFEDLNSQFSFNMNQQTNSTYGVSNEQYGCSILYNDDMSNSNQIVLT